MNYYFDVLKKYAQFSGRARRKEYWMFFLFNMIIVYGLIFLGTVSEYFLIAYGIYALGVLLPSLAVGVRRMHDVGKSGWFLLIPIYSLILAVTEGEKGNNRYGKDPKSPGDELNEIGVPQE
ncbi:DUF805 domain-containing protein [Flavobacterium suncheonense]|uniref:Uncharacterized protein n=1 Tax=Flavobacterium suncheonense GH29-5 = DSM 17707 TaxID=1121899 RepID=A0A0A2MC89_9FLAO|nr:DUF805 domain-containing protein [Flavobacterium suncheonense]KGO89221.1 hypothetical protein Q764_09135 [Flavobacterium suncheonense GH29-5 = DSM 17707]